MDFRYDSRLRPLFDVSFDFDFIIIIIIFQGKKRIIENLACCSIEKHLLVLNQVGV